ncbi:hypothetical protein ACWC4J_16745 [Streptomyces sp. NPDC001356]
MSPPNPTPHSRPATHPDGGWGAQRPPLPALPLGVAAAQCDEKTTPVTLRCLALSDRSRHGSDESRAGLLSLLGASLDAAPEELVVDDGPCPHCARRHALAATSPTGVRRYFAAVRHSGHVVYAVCLFPVGLGLAVAEAHHPARARKPARLAAHRGAVARGRCVGPRDGSVEYVVRYVGVEHLPECVVSVVWEVSCPAGT